MDGVLPSLVTELLKQLGSFAAQQALQELLLLVGVDEEIENLQYNFKMVQAMLNKFEERRLRDDAVKLWYDKLEDAYYMMDDVLDTWETAKIKLQIQKEEEGERAAHSNAPAPLEKKMKKVWSFFPSPSCCCRQVDNVSVRHEIGHKIKKLNETLANILKGKQEFGIDSNSQPERVERREITSIVDVSKIFGRNEYNDDPLNNLLGVGSRQESNPLVISLVGVGGIGKSTVAKLAYNHPKVKDYFQKIIWVCISDPFDQCKVAKAIIQELAPTHESLNNTTTTLQALLCIVCDFIKDKKFFLVFDDVWAKDVPKESEKWEPFKDALTHGAQGSRILVTTRNEDVAHMMGSTKTHIINLGNLSVDDCWLIIRKIAFNDENIDQHKDLEPLGRKLANKCHGLPLAAKLIGGYMCNKRRKEQWEKVLENSLWDLEDVEKGLLGPLLLSYYELSLAEKKCFLFCAVFPKDYKINRFELIIHWMAQGYIDIDSKRNMEMEDMAEEYFQKLAMRSFFQDFGENEIDGRIESCKMHDIVHDFAQTMTKDVCFTIEGDKEVKIDFKRARQLSLIVEGTFPESVYEAKNLRFLNLKSWSSQIVQPKLLDNLTCLRTLHWKRVPSLELLNGVEKLIHLRYLKLDSFDMEELPESICNLCNLQILDVSEWWSLRKLSQGISKLINLRHLHLAADPQLDYSVITSFPKGIGRLTCLKTLKHFPIDGKGEEICKLGELEHLNHIQGTLNIYGLKNVVDFGAIENTLKKKDHLRDLCLFFCTVQEEEDGEGEEETDEERRRRMENDVALLNALKPPLYLESLKIRYYKGITVYPNWMMSKLTNLKRLTLYDCPNLERLPPLGKLPLLEELHISYTTNIRKVGDEFLGIGIEEEELSESSKNNNNKDIIISPNLKFLEFVELDEWEEWSGMGGTIEEEEEEKDNSANAFVTNNTPKIQIMPLLHSLTIWHCGNLKSLPDYLRNTPLKKLQIWGEGIGDYWPNFSHIPNIRINYEYVQKDGQLRDRQH
ncbi:putative disease resistance protein RGA3 [Quercus robur]|uniref:putative disease resistance protein RGA3 n=1 Tax=Quercus robur TaxID=38942 RepID=UPI0021626DD8|nr:putative disease resistance protein RGA3 [Quercus robur]XP_050289396.1 putative disease resistance protein RGA3 [Quercus robur]XP_050289397.1 putative disease resistance protein RGA3 [Quercus robur]XP_050289398.1 putative disease resistance protein RGA3 [Quercus robur]XP_050289399.1 putative disease resistance protein RGA3 [Quercus robur]XP_050289400.1 putative disease resistance protein RGA3 [Quercus robur]XP_050289401.1 putative disease resistance protein RGA3 [Quercus robur]XP_05028940